MDLVNRIRNIRAEKGLAPATRLEAVVRPTAPGALEALNASSAEVVTLARLSELVPSEQVPEGDGWSSAPCGAYDVYVRVPVEAADPEAERARLEANLKKADKEREKFAKKLENPSFRDKAPEAVVEKTGTLCHQQEQQVEALKAALEKN